MLTGKNTALRGDTTHCLEFFLILITKSKFNGNEQMILQEQGKEILTIYF